MRSVNIVSNRTASCSSGTGLRDMVQQVWNCANSCGKDEVAERQSWGSQGALRDSKLCVNTCRGSGCVVGGDAAGGRPSSKKQRCFGVTHSPLPSEDRVVFVIGVRFHLPDCISLRRHGVEGCSVSVFRGCDSEDSSALSLTHHLDIT